MSTPPLAYAYTAKCDTLVELGEGALDGHPLAVLIDGPPDSGKSALLETFARTHICRSATLAQFRCTPETAHDEFRVVRELHAQSSSEHGDAARHDARWHDVRWGEVGWGDLAASPVGEDPGPWPPAVPPGDAVRKSHPASVLRPIMAGVLAAAPLVVLIDDAQWCDESSLRFFGFLLRRVCRERFFLVLVRGSHQPGPADRPLAEISAQRRCRVVRVPAPSRPLSADRRVERDGSALARQPAHVRAVATALALLGGADVGLVAALAGVPLHTAELAIDVLRDNRIVVGRTSRSDDAVVREPIRDELLSRLTGGERARWHARAARLLSDAARPVIEVAEHVVALPRLDEPWMSEVLLDAAVAAERRDAPELAARYLARAVAATPERLALRIALARALVIADPPAAMTELRVAAGIAPDLAGRCTIVVLFAIAAMAGRAPAKTFVLVKELLGRFAKADKARAGEGEAESRALAVAALVALGTTRQSALEWLRAEIGAVPKPSADVRALADRAVALAVAGQRVEVAAAYARGVLRRREAWASGGDPLAPARVLHLADDLPNAMRALDMVVAEHATDGDPVRMSKALATRALVLRDSGNLDEALRDTRAAALAAGRDRASAHGVAASIALATALRGEQAYDAAERLLLSVDRDALETTSWEFHGYLVELAGVRYLRGDAEGALRHLAESGRQQDDAGIRNPVFAPWWFTSALILAELKRTAEATACVERGHELAAQWQTAKARGLLLVARGAIMGGARAVELFQEASRLLAASPSRIEQARAEYLLGRALLSTEDRKAARRHLRQAAVLSVRCGWHSLGALARDLLGAAGGRMRHPIAHRAGLLTRREREVAELVARGASNRDVAKTLFVSSRTVELHLTNIYRKLAVDSRAALPAALRDGAATPVSGGPYARVPGRAGLLEDTLIGRRHGLAG